MTQTPHSSSISMVAAPPPPPSSSELLDLFDLHWFTHQILNTNPTPHSPPQNPLPQFQEFNRKPPNLRSLSSQSLTSNSSNSDTSSPISVLRPHFPSKTSSKLEIKQESGLSMRRKSSIEGAGSKQRKSRGRGGGGGEGSKSLSELEFEELKGLMDLGFVFDEEELDSRLVSIVPGLQRFGDNEKQRRRNGDVSRPYLSEAWDVMEEEKEKEKLLVDLRLPDLRNEIDVKKKLRFWAHNVVASALGT